MLPVGEFHNKNYFQLITHMDLDWWNQNSVCYYDLYAKAFSFIDSRSTAEVRSCKTCTALPVTSVAANATMIRNIMG